MQKGAIQIHILIFRYFLSAALLTVTVPNKLNKWLHRSCYFQFSLIQIKLLLLLYSRVLFMHIDVCHVHVSISLEIQLHSCTFFSYWALYFYSLLYHLLFFFSSFYIVYLCVNTCFLPLTLNLSCNIWISPLWSNKIIFLFYFRITLGILDLSNEIIWNWILSVTVIIRWH